MAKTKLTDITPYPKNAKQHSTAQVKQIAESIKAFGFNQPVVVDKKGVIIVGHGRYEAAKLLGLKEVPTIEVDLTEKQAKAYRLADNKLNESGWDMDLVIQELKDLEDEALVALTGFEKDLLVEANEQDDVIPKNAPTRAKLGDLWQLGQHRVLCGDATQQEAVLALMGGNKADMVFTDPPYGFNYQKKSSGETIQNDGNEFQEVLRKAILNMTDCPKYICGDFRTCEKLKDACSSLGEPTNCIVWKKPVQQRLHQWEYCHEFIWFFGKNGSGFIDGNVWECKREIAKMHPTIKPVELISKAITAHNGEIIQDLFLGSGSTLIACEKTNRICYGMEIDPRYTDVIIKRWEDYTGSTAVKLN